ncbi:RNA recognition, RNP-1 [Cordyceps fumosorosea ARSEF 2679]|uniref:RNA recognition, RNP-1 n=1 Tax=Cordyceps fumosorosea (strain ARSEF 2679) TaxID=1081104 RepID=A0A167SZY4_CORFA|nr:RNA recognition, RNP-1 [Cordyceps fumosorosea ARSEF 2679]OAA60104.1 RNA recognition, RNP-1 [Cordyceps fumosorosea ARSEF 2679]
MATQSQSLLKLFTPGSDISKISFDPSLPSPPDSNSSCASSAMLSRVNSASSAVVMQSKLNPESAVWMPPGWGEFSPAPSKNGTPAKGQGEEPRSGDYAFPSYTFITSPSSSHRHHHVRGKSSITSPMPTSGRMTEPRNYAPRTSGRPMRSEPPPKFNLELPTVSQHEWEVLPPPEAFDHQLGAMVQQVLPAPQALTVYQPPVEVYDGRSDKLKALTNPAWGDAMLAAVLDPSNMPFVEAAKQATAKNHGVVRLGNIPFATKRSEVIAFLGRNSKILNDADEPVHIIMEKVTSKTMDAYVEFMTLEDAMRAVEKHAQNQLSGRPTRLGDRPVDLQLSSQANLMKDLFPVAAGVVWKGVTPEIQPHKPNEPWANFKGFISAEEMVMLVKHVEVPHRSPFSKECPQRPYECLISTLRKFPWYMTACITVAQRGAMFQATCDLLRLLLKSLDKGDDPVNLSNQLLRRVAKAAMECPGFTALMKDDIVWIVGMSEDEQRAYGQPRFASSWRHQYALVPKLGMPLDVVEWYIAAIRDRTMRDVFALPHGDRRAVQEKAQSTDGYWGYFWNELNYPEGAEFDTMTLAHVAQVEFGVVETILARAFGSM